MALWLCILAALTRAALFGKHFDDSLQEESSTRVQGDTTESQGGVRNGSVSEDCIR